MRTTREYSSDVGFRAILRTRPYFPLPSRFARSSIRRWTSQLLSTIPALHPSSTDALPPPPLPGPLRPPPAPPWPPPAPLTDPPHVPALSERRPPRPRSLRTDTWRGS